MTHIDNAGKSMWRGDIHEVEICEFIDTYGVRYIANKWFYLSKKLLLRYFYTGSITDFNYSDVAMKLLNQLGYKLGVDASILSNDSLVDIYEYNKQENYVGVDEAMYDAFRCRGRIGSIFVKIDNKGHLHKDSKNSCEFINIILDKAFNQTMRNLQ